MTHVDKSSVRREVTGLSGDTYMIEVLPEGMYFREKGKRTKYGPVSWDFLFRRAVDLTVQRSLDAKPRRRRAISRGLLTTGR